MQLKINLPLVSVLMTAYNREKYIAFAIESVLKSTYPLFELIILDDASTDSTVQIANMYAVIDARVKVWVNIKNLGDYPNRNKIASYATGKYLKYLDSDDYIYPSGLEIMVNMMEQFPLAGWGICTLSPQDDRPFPIELSSLEAYRYHYFGPGLFHRAPLSSIMHRTVFEELGGFRDIRMAGDFEIWHRLAQKYPVVLMPQGIIWYRKHDQQEINDFHDFTNVYESIKLDYLIDPECPLTKDEISNLLRNFKYSTLKALVKSMIKLDTRRAKENFYIIKKLILRK